MGIGQSLVYAWLHSAHTFPAAASLDVVGLSCFRRLLAMLTCPLPTSAPCSTRCRGGTAAATSTRAAGTCTMCRHERSASCCGSSCHACTTHTTNTQHRQMDCVLTRKSQRALRPGQPRCHEWQRRAPTKHPNPQSPHQRTNKLTATTPTTTGPGPWHTSSQCHSPSNVTISSAPVAASPDH